MGKVSVNAALNKTYKYATTGIYRIQVSEMGQIGPCVKVDRRLRTNFPETYFKIQDCKLYDLDDFLFL